jgi:flagellar protein FliO/FliZ
LAESPIETGRPAAEQDGVIAAESGDEPMLEPFGEPAPEPYDPLPETEAMAPANQPRTAIEPETAADRPRRPAFLTRAPVVPPLRAERAEPAPQPIPRPAPASAPAVQNAVAGPAAEARRISNLISRVTNPAALFGRGNPARAETAENSTPTPAADRPAIREPAMPAPRIMPASASSPSPSPARVAMPAAGYTAPAAHSSAVAAPRMMVQQPVTQPVSQPTGPAPMAATAQAAAVAQPAPAASQAAPAAPSIPPVQQQRLNGLDPRERIASNRTEEAQLDIPAFLRRQAN